MDSGRNPSTYLQRIGQRRASSIEPNLREAAGRRVRQRLTLPLSGPPDSVAQNPTQLTIGPTVSDLEEDTGYEEEPRQRHHGLDLGTTSDPRKREVSKNGENLTEVGAGREARTHLAPEEDPSELNPEVPRRDEESFQEEGSSEEFQEGVLLSSPQPDLSENGTGYNNNAREALGGAPFQYEEEEEEEEEDDFSGELVMGRIILEGVMPLQILPYLDPWSYSGDADAIAPNDEIISCSIQESIFLSEQHEAGFCIFCQEEFLNGEKIGMLKCNHQFHSEELSKWLKQKAWCPVCKARSVA